MRLPLEARDCCAIICAYALGCFTSGYYLVRWGTGEDIRSSGSGSTGATNVGRSLGRSGFIGTFALDCLKGGAAVGLARFLGLEPMSLILVMLAVVAGHLWPLQLHFKGGKGIATSAGALLAFDYQIVVVLAGLSLLLFFALRNFVLSGLAAFILTPLVLYGLKTPLLTITGFSILTVMILVAHRRNIPEEWSVLISGNKSRRSYRETRKE